MELIVASNNQGKIKEFSRILTPLGFEVVSLKQAGIVSTPEEDGDTFAENARIKAMAVFESEHKACIADDSGLSVNALSGEPGVFTARYAGEDATDDENNAKLLENLKDKLDRSAKFICALHLVLENGEEIAVQGECKGSIALCPRGENGFGYDPLFLVDDKCYAELSAEQKDAISHRGNALKQLVEILEKRNINC